MKSLALIILRLLLRKWLSIWRLVCTSVVRMQAGSAGSPLKVNGWSRVTGNTFLGSNVHFNGLQIHGTGRVEIGDNFHSGVDCLIICSNHNYDNGKTIPYDEVDVPKNVIIESNVWIGSRVTILGGVRIGEGAVIQAGAVVVKDIPPCAVAGGSPAKMFKMRDQVHYLEKKAAGQFN